MKLAATGSTVIGPAHKQDNQPNQDAVIVHGIRKGWCIAVCDGLGSREKSHIGSQKAAQMLRHSLRLQHKNNAITPLQISLLTQSSWLDLLGRNRRSYETTCIWAHIRANGTGQAAQIGDGLLLIKADGVFRVISPAREGFGNQTLSLGQAKTTEWTTIEFRLTKAGDGVLLMTDGISDDLISDQLEGFFDAIFQQLNKSNKRRSKRWLTKELEEWSTPKHGDDKSIAGIFWVE